MFAKRFNRWKLISYCFRSMKGSTSKMLWLLDYYLLGIWNGTSVQCCFGLRYWKQRSVWHRPTKSIPFALYSSLHRSQLKWIFLSYFLYLLVQSPFLLTFAVFIAVHPNTECGSRTKPVEVMCMKSLALMIMEKGWNGQRSWYIKKKSHKHMVFNHEEWPIFIWNACGIDFSLLILHWMLLYCKWLWENGEDGQHHW